MHVQASEHSAPGFVESSREDDLRGRLPADQTPFPKRETCVVLATTDPSRLAGSPGRDCDG